MKAAIYSLITLFVLQLVFSCQGGAQEMKMKQHKTVIIKPDDIPKHGDIIILHPSASRYVINDTLSKPEKSLVRISKQDVMEQLSKEKVEYFSITPDSLVFFGNHPFLAGMVKAYQEHRPVIISPDIIWTLIEQGFARHMAISAEKFRDRLVDFPGKREITVVMERDNIKLGNAKSKWGLALPQFTEQIEKFTGKTYVSNLRADFSTTTTDSRVVSEVILMESVKSFFDYRMMVMGCGISSITLEGTVADWEIILKKMDYLETFDLAWWTAELRPIIKQIIQSKKGNLDRDFWSNMVQMRNKEVYAPHEKIDGWIVKLYPFTDKGEPRKLLPISNMSLIAPEYVKVPFIYEDRELKEEHAMEIWAGLFGMEQDQKNLGLKPVIGWSIVHRGKLVSNNLPQKDSYDIVSFKNIKELPTSFYGIKNISRLELSFIGKINISEKIKDVKIRQVDIKGEIDKQEKERLRILFPHAVIRVNEELVSP